MESKINGIGQYLTGLLWINNFISDLVNKIYRILVIVNDNKVYLANLDVILSKLNNHDLGT